MTWKPIVTYLTRGSESVFAVIILGLASGVLAKLGHNDSRTTYALVVSVFNIIYFGYSQAMIPTICNYRTFSSLIFACETLFAIFYLAAFAAIADAFPTGNCNAFGGGDLTSACRMYQALLPFTLLNWLLFSTDLVLFIGFSYIPEIATYGFAHTFVLSKFQFGAIFSDYVTIFGKPIPGVKTEVEGDGTAAAGAAAGAAPIEGAPAADVEANVGLASTDEDQEKDRTPEQGTDGANDGNLAAGGRPYP
ncbi:hypothetical protein Cantr_00753 [Candida viswanathii]|uniref:MARVEL domain-containing protein n=1 Tax=Candida viswanathii TaxID=5486 RepID=A0A367YHE6_9ASCO|nr:hypothetical protein Cantr_00753 [Candida viswanathii]